MWGSTAWLKATGGTVFSRRQRFSRGVCFCELVLVHRLCQVVGAPCKAREVSTQLRAGQVCLVEALDELRRAHARDLVLHLLEQQVDTALGMVAHRVDLLAGQCPCKRRNMEVAMPDHILDGARCVDAALCAVSVAVQAEKGLSQQGIVHGGCLNSHDRAWQGGGGRLRVGARGNDDLLLCKAL